MRAAVSGFSDLLAPHNVLNHFRSYLVMAILISFKGPHAASRVASSFEPGEKSKKLDTTVHWIWKSQRVSFTHESLPGPTFSSPVTGRPDIAIPGPAYREK